MNLVKASISYGFGQSTGSFGKAKGFDDMNADSYSEIFFFNISFYALRALHF